MQNESTAYNADDGITLVLGGTGKTARRVAERLQSPGVATRVASRSGDPSFDWNDPGTWGAALDWNDPGTWGAALDGVTAAYITYSPDLAIPGATEAIPAFVENAVAQGVERMVLLSGRGEEEAQACERIVQEADVEWTIVRASWFMQNFSEGEFAGMVMEGAITLPAADIPEPFVDVNDIADVAVAALTQAGHAYEVYDVTGPRLLTSSELAREISDASGRDVRFVPIPGEAFAKAIAESGTPEDVAWLLNYLFDTVLDGRNAHVGDGVQRALDREPADFAAYAEWIAARGTWNTPDGEEAA